MEKIKVLIADDMEVNAEMIKRMLVQDEDIKVLDIAKDGQEEFDKIVELQPDLVFTDNKMPKLNGIDVVELINNSQMEKKPKFVLVTGDRDIEIYNLALKLGIISVINKPFSSENIANALNEYKESIKEKEENCNEILEITTEEKRGFWQKILNIFKKNKN